LTPVDHHRTDLFDIDVRSTDASEHVIKPYDPDRSLHHLVHKVSSQKRGQGRPEEPAFYKKTAAASAQAGRITVIGHGAGKCNAAHHLTEYLLAHRRPTYNRIAREMLVDLSSVTSLSRLMLRESRCADDRQN
jgi:hypothetical protein